MNMKNNYVIRKINYFIYNLKWWTWKRFKFQIYLWSIGGINAGYFTRPNQYYFKFRVKLFDLWNYLFVDKISFKDNQFANNGVVIDIHGKKHTFYYDYEQGKNNPFRQKLNIRSLFASPGWEDLIMKLIKDIVKKGWNKEICQVKEKYGGLRFYINGASDEVHDLINKAEDDSYEVCEWCGSKDNVTQTSGWVTTLCEKCMIKNNKPKDE